MSMRRSDLGATLAGLVLIAVAPLAGATNTRAELEGVLEDLMAWLPGEYSSRPQVELETLLGAPPDGKHYDWYRIFARIDAPQLGEHVIYGELHVGSKDEPVVPGTQVVYLISIDEAHGAVNVNGRRIKNPEAYGSLHLDPTRAKTVEVDPNYGGNCDFRWRRHGDQLVGRLAQPDEAAIDGDCVMTSKVSGVTMRWDAEWVLTPEELWIYDNGYVRESEQPETWRLFQGREDRTHIRLSRVRQYTCGVQLAVPGSEPRRFELELHNRGGQAELAGQDMSLRLFRGPLSGHGERPDDFTVLSLHRVSDGREVARGLWRGVTDYLGIEAPPVSAHCAGR